MPDKIGETRPNSRHAENFVMPKCRTETYRTSFIPSTTRVWNELPSESRNIEYVTGALKTKSNILYYEGSRVNNIKHAQLRMQCSKLNAHLFSLHVVDSPQCICGHDLEDSEHFLLNCPLYLVQRQEMLQKLNQLHVANVDLDTLLFGDTKTDFKTNQNLFKAVHEFISASGRL